MKCHTDRVEETKVRKFNHYSL